MSSVAGANLIGTYKAAGAASTGGVVFDARSSAGNPSGYATSLTWSHTCSGSNRLLVVTIVTEGSAPTATLSSVTYAGRPMTQIGTYVNPPSPATRAISIWYLINPPAGANDIVATLPPPGGSRINGQAFSFTGADQVAGIHNFVAARGTVLGPSSQPSVTVASATGEMVVDTVATDATTDLYVAPGDGQAHNQTNVNQLSFMPDGSTRAGASSVSVSWTNDFVGDTWAIVAASVVSRDIATAGVRNGGKRKLKMTTGARERVHD